MPRKRKNEKRLEFILSVKEYSDFWHVGSLLNLSKKKPIFLKMVGVIKELLEEGNFK